MCLMLTKLVDWHILISAKRRAQSNNLAANRRSTRHNFKLAVIIRRIAQQCGMITLGNFLNNWQNLIFMRLRTQNYRAIWLNNARLRASNLLNSVSKPLHVIHIHRANNCSIRIHNVRGIPFATHANFHNSNVNRSVRKSPNRHGCKHFKEAHFWLTVSLHASVNHVDNIFHLIPNVHKIVVADFLAVNHNALVYALQMWRSIKSCAQTVRAANRLGHASCRTFAVRAGNMNNVHRLFRMAKNIKN